MRLIVAFTLLILMGTANAASVEKGGLTWYDDLEEVHKLSMETKKPVFGFFTGSDWCGWCHKLQREVFAKPAFIEWAKKNVILLEVDFPKRTAQSPELRAQNQNLQRAFGVTGYPTVWLFTSSKNAETGAFNLTSMGRLGYPRGAVAGKEEVRFIQEANKILAGDNRAAQP